MRRIAQAWIHAAGFVLLASIAGCAKSSQQSLDAYLKQTGHTRAEVFPLAGKVTIDGQPARYVKPLRLVVMLYDASKPNLPAFRRPCRECNADGEFSFNTYTQGDGLPPGNYVVTFAVLNVTMQGLKGPDQLKNLYNDPERNARNPAFKIDHGPPGKKDYLFDLKVDGQAAIEMPGPNSLTELPLGG
jgi:hypothetical protein